MSSQLRSLLNGFDTVLPEGSLEAKCALDRPLRVKVGFDPTAADLHLGHAVLFKKLADFQSLGHQIVIIIGDYTARIGDPSGRNSTRPPLSPEQINEFANTYEEQLFIWLDKDKTEVRYNSEWYDHFDLKDILHICGQVTLAQLLERDDFSKRYSAQLPIGMHELLYPILQGYDSVMVKADVELGGTDQTFNLMMGRECQRMYQQAPQAVCTVPLLVGTDGVKKMSKSYGNHIALKDSAQEMYGKAMSIPDQLLWSYFSLLTHEAAHDIEKRAEKVEQGENPMTHKHDLARHLVERYHGSAQAAQSHQGFIDQFSRKQVPDDMVEIEVALTDVAVPLHVLLREWELAKSSSDARRLITQGAVKINGHKVHEDHIFDVGTYVLQVGKRRWLKVTFY